MHREGHAWPRQSGGGPHQGRMVQLHRFAGHIARATDGIARIALRTRNLAWWRDAQQMHGTKRGGVHPARFKAWRWESQLAAFYGEAEGGELEQNYGWMVSAQDRTIWKSNEVRFSTS